MISEQQVPEGALELTKEEGDVTRFRSVSADRQGAYRHAIAAGMRDVAHRHRDPGWEMIVSPDAARWSLALALAAQEAVETRGVVSLSVAD